MIAKYPTPDDAMDFAKEADAVDLIQTAVRAIRNVRTSMNVPPSKKANVYVVSADENVRETFGSERAAFAMLARADEIIIQDNKDGIDEKAVSAIIPNAELYIPFEQLVDIAQETERLTKEKQRLTKEIARCEGMLGNEKFISKAPAAKVDEEKKKLETYRGLMEQVESRLEQLK